MNNTDTLQEIENLKKQVNWYKSFFENSCDAIIILEPESLVIQDVNDYATQIMGIPKEQLIDKVIPQFRRTLKLLKKSDSPVVLSEMTFDSPIYGEMMIEVNARFVDYDGKKVIKSIIRDVSEQHTLTDKMVQADKLVLMGQLTASVAHEIRNPLAAINLNLQIMQRKTPTDLPDYNHIKTALQGVERISKIVELTLNFSRQSIPEIKPLNLNTIITPTIELLSTSIKKKDIFIDQKLSEDLPMVAADMKQMQQVLINIIKNAADAISDTGMITIKTFTEPAFQEFQRDYVVVSVSDTGMGIAPEDLPKIFNPFFTRKEEGTGLGLPITQRILHQHNGIIDVESTLGAGTTIYIKLPVIPVN